MSVISCGVGGRKRPNFSETLHWPAIDMEPTTTEIKSKAQLQINDILPKVKEPILSALKANLIPGLALFMLEAVLITVYFYCIECSPPFIWLGQTKERYGYLYSAVSTYFFGGFLPFCIGILTKEIPVNDTKLLIQTFLLLLVLWSFCGVLVDAFYRFQGWLWGNDSSVQTIACKVAFDMFCYTPLFGIWIMIFPLHWRTCKFSFKEFYQTLTLEFIIITASTVLCTAWMIWIPSVTVVYSLPENLQLPVANLILCFYNLVLMFATRHLARSMSTKEQHEGTPLLPI